MFSIFACAFWPSVYLLWRNVYLDLLPIIWLGHLFVFWYWLVWTICMWVLVTLSHVWFCDPMDCSLPGFSVHRILQARILEWVDIPFSRGPSQPRDRTWVSCFAGRFFPIWATREAPCLYMLEVNPLSVTSSEKVFSVNNILMNVWELGNDWHQRRSIKSWSF